MSAPNITSNRGEIPRYNQPPASTTGVVATPQNFAVNRFINAAKGITFSPLQHRLLRTAMDNSPNIKPDPSQQGKGGEGLFNQEVDTSQKDYNQTVVDAALVQAQSGSIQTLAQPSQGSLLERSWEFVKRNKWWFIGGGAVVGGWLVFRRK